MGKMKSTFRPSMTLTNALWETINRGALIPEQLQDEIDYSASALKRAGIDGESGAGFNLRKLLPLMIAQNDCTILELIAFRCNKILIDIPVSGRSKKNRVKSVAEYQKACALAISAVIRFIDDGGSEEAYNALFKALKSTAELMEDVKKGRQIELDFDTETGK